MPNSALANQTTVSIKTEWQNGTTGKVVTTQTFNKLAVSVVKSEYPNGEIKTALYKDNTKLIEISNKSSEQHSIFGKTDPLEAELEALNNIGLASGSGVASNSGGNAATSGYHSPPRASNSVPIANLNISDLVAGIAIPSASPTVKSVSIYNNTDGTIWVRHGADPISSTFENAYYPIRPGGNSEYNAALGHWMGEIQIKSQNVTSGWFTVVRES